MYVWNNIILIEISEELEAIKAQNKKLSLELEVVKNELCAVDFERNSYLSAKSKCDDEIASLQKIVNGKSVCLFLCYNFSHCVWN